MEGSGPIFFANKRKTYLHRFVSGVFFGGYPWGFVSFAAGQMVVKLLLPNGELFKNLVPQS